MPACCCSASDKRKASCFPSINSSFCNFQGDHRVSGWASQEGLGKLPAVDVGSNIFIIDDLYLSESKRVVSRPLLKNGLVGLDKLLFRKFPLLNR